MSKKSTISKIEKIATQSTEVNNPLVVNPNRQAEIIAECDKAGLTLAHLVKTVYDGTNAMKTTVDKFGDEHSEPDVQARLKAAGIGFDLRGETNSKAGTNVQTNIVAVIENLSIDAKSRLKEWDKRNVVDTK